jgi:hypothetical protein
MSHGRRGELTIECRAFRREWIESWVEVAVDGKSKSPPFRKERERTGHSAL